MRNFIIHNPLVPIICGLTTGTLLGRIISGVSIQLTILFSIIIVGLALIFIYRIKEVMKLNKTRKEYWRRVDEFVNKNQR